MKVVLHNAQQGHQMLMTLWPKMKAALTAGRKLTLTVEGEKRSLPQNAMYHAIIGQIAKQAKSHGSKWNSDDWKRYLTQEWCNETGREYIKMKRDGDRMMLDILHTSGFDKPQASEFTEFCIAWAAQNGVEISKD